jgi:hypothetical protein
MKKIITLWELLQLLKKRPLKEYAIVVIDNAPPLRPQLPLKGKNFIWIQKSGPIPTARKDLEEIFQKFDLYVKKDQPIAVFHHHDFQKPFFATEEKVEFYEFSHSDTLAYKAFSHADASFLSHMLSRTFHQYEKVILVKTNLSDDEIRELQKKHWIFELPLAPKEAKVGKEDFLIYTLALSLSGGKVIPDPKRYRPEDHDQIIREGIPVDMYAIPAMFKKVEIRTGTYLDQKIVKKMKEKIREWQKEIKKLQKEKEIEVAKKKEREEKRKKGELLPEDAKAYVDSIAPSLGYDFTDDPVYPETRKDICVIRRMVENGVSYGYDIIYLLWRVGDEIKIKKLIDSASTKDYIHIRSVKETRNGIKIKVGSGGSYSGNPWEKSFEVSFKEMEEEEPKEPKSELKKFSEGMLSQVDFLEQSLPPSAQPFMKAMRKQLVRTESLISGKKTKGEEKLKNHTQLLEEVKKKHPLSEIFRLEIIAEVYDDKLIRETLELLKLINDKKVANEAIHILSEMAMMENSPSLYFRFVKLLKYCNDEERMKILTDERFEFQTDEMIQKAIKDYEK